MKKQNLIKKIIITLSVFIISIQPVNANENSFNEFTRKFNEFLNVIDGATYNVRVKAINSLGVNSTFTSASHTVVGATETPSDVTDLSVSMVGSNQMELSWTPVTDLDISWYEVRFQDVYPVSLGALSYDQAASDVQYLSVTADFDYKIYEIVTL